MSYISISFFSFLLERKRKRNFKIREKGKRKKKWKVNKRKEKEKKGKMIKRIWLHSLQFWQKSICFRNKVTPFQRSNGCYETIFYIYKKMNFSDYHVKKLQGKEKWLFVRRVHKGKVNHVTCLVFKILRNEEQKCFR